MTLEMLKRLIYAGDKTGNLLKGLAAEVGTTDLNKISDEVAEEYLKKHGTQDVQED